MDFFNTDAGFLTYTGALALSAVLMLVLAVTGFGLTTGGRVLNGVIGLGAGAYAAYLFFNIYINGGEYRIFIYAFVLPIIAIFQIVKGLKERNAAAEAAMNPIAPVEQPVASPVQE